MKIKKSHVNINVGLLILILSLTIAGTINQTFKPQYKLETPKSSDGEITIITPENKTYTEPDNGYYPATYGFENDANMDYPSDWGIHENGGTLKVIAGLQGHNKVIEFYRNSVATQEVYMYQNLSPKTNGTVEYWVLIADVSEYMGIHIYNGASVTTQFAIRGSKWQYASPIGWENVPNLSDPQSNRWYHISINFECSTNNYKNLGQYKQEFFVDGVSSGELDFRFNYDEVNHIRFTNGRDDNDYFGYIDAIGLSWDSDYKIGDNLNEGLLLSYDSNIDFNWTGYSLDGQTNRTTLGNTTIPMPNDGVHNIQVFGNDSVGTMYESNIRYFTVSTAPPEVTINSPTPSQTIGTSAPSYDISITEPYDSIWYTFDGGTTNITASSLTGTINQAAWTALSDGIITITFFVNNSAGMEGSAQVQVIKDSSEEPLIPPGIPGYNTIALIGVTLAVTLILAKRKLKK